MRHGKKGNHLGRKRGHRKALLKNLSNAIIEHKRISTTLAKAKALRVFLEPIITKAKNNTTHSRRTVFSYLQNKEAVNMLFGEVAAKIGDRPGGYLRIIKTGHRDGDNAETAIIEFVDYNEIYTKEAKSEKKRSTRRGRRKKSAESAAAAATTVEAAEEIMEDAEEIVDENKSTEEPDAEKEDDSEDA